MKSIEKSLGMEIEVVDIRKITGEGNLKAFADVKIANSLIIRGVSVLNGKNGIFVSLPKKAGKEGKWFDIITPLSDDLKEGLQDKVLEAYDREADGVKN